MYTLQGKIFKIGHIDTYSTKTRKWSERPLVIELPSKYAKKYLGLLLIDKQIQEYHNLKINEYVKVDIDIDLIEYKEKYKTKIVLHQIVNSTLNEFNYFLVRSIDNSILFIEAKEIICDSNQNTYMNTEALLFDGYTIETDFNEEEDDDVDLDINFIDPIDSHNLNDWADFNSDYNDWEQGNY